MWAPGTEPGADAEADAEPADVDAAPSLEPLDADGAAPEETLGSALDSISSWYQGLWGDSE